MERVLVGIQEICILPADCLHILIQGGWVKQVIMIEESDIISGRHIETGICIFTDAPVIIQLTVFDPFIPAGQFFTDHSDICVFRVTAVRQAQFPVTVGLLYD